ncbi:Ig-like domain-containing protein [Streptomyces sp. NBC_01167]|uniref:L,D-transpeptidase n=1 Tax=Streptomyces sp. NBC_01167 TaxID=2903756 RepID=UPI003865B814
MSRTRPRFPLGRRPVRPVVSVGGAVLAVLLTGCSGGTADADADGKDGPAISVTPTGKQAAGEPVRVTLAEGKLKEVTVTDAKGGRLDGRIADDGRSWTSVRPATPGARYSIAAKDTHGGASTAAFATAAPARVNKLAMAPGKNATVGVAHPLSIVFDHPVKNRAAVEKQLKVTTSNNTEGSWGWMRDWSGRDRVDWRPKEHWQPGTRVSLDAKLSGIDSGAGGWFVRDYATTYTIGRSQSVAVDLDRHRLTLVRDGRAVGAVPMSAGTPGGEKASWRGRTVLMAKEGTINMRSETVGLGDAYNKMVDYSMRLTWSGMYAHAAPWNAGYFGNANRSSGCIGMSDADAKWVYGQVQVGDPFEVTGNEAKGTQALNNGYGEWNLPWDAWRTKSALY